MLQVISAGKSSHCPPHIDPALGLILSFHCITLTEHKGFQWAVSSREWLKLRVQLGAHNCKISMSCQYTYTQHNAQRHITSSSKRPEPQSNQKKASGNAHGESAGQGTVFFKSIMIGKKGWGPDMPEDQEDLTTEPRWESALAQAETEPGKHQLRVNVPWLWQQMLSVTDSPGLQRGCKEWLGDMLQLWMWWCVVMRPPAPAQLA